MQGKLSPQSHRHAHRPGARARLRLVTSAPPRRGCVAGRPAPRLWRVCEPVGAYHNFALPEPTPSLTERPRQLLQLLARHDLTLAQAAERMHISISTANQHVATAKRALGAHTLTGAVVIALRRGLIEL